MNRISKPRIVDFLRLCDRNKWVHPRIRFASVRSKPELIDDIHHNFDVTVDKHLVTITPRSSCRRVPVIQYDLEARKYLVDGVYEGVEAETGVSDSVRADDDPFRIVSSVQRVERHTNSFWRFVTVSNTRHWCSSSCLIINSAIWALLAYSLHNNFTSLDIGHEKIRHASRERRTRFGNVLQDTPHMNSEISQWRPLMAKWLICSAASLVSTTSSTKIATCRWIPSARSRSCCCIRRSTNDTSHVLKKNRLSHFCSMRAANAG